MEMNKIFLPTILAATILLAGVFAVMPVEKASTVHTTILANTIELKTIACAETVDMAGGNDDGTFTLDLPAAAGIMLLTDIQLVSGAQPLDANDTLAFTVLVTDATLVTDDAVATIADITFDAAPVEGTAVEMNFINTKVAAADQIVLTVDGTTVGNTSDYTITFWYLAPGNDGDAICTPALL